MKTTTPASDVDLRATRLTKLEITQHVTATVAYYVQCLFARQIHQAHLQKEEGVNNEQSLTQASTVVRSL